MAENVNKKHRKFNHPNSEDEKDTPSPPKNEESIVKPNYHVPNEVYSQQYIQIPLVGGSPLSTNQNTWMNQLPQTYTLPKGERSIKHQLESPQMFSSLPSTSRTHQVQDIFDPKYSEHPSYYPGVHHNQYPDSLVHQTPSLYNAPKYYHTPPLPHSQPFRGPPIGPYAGPVDPFALGNLNPFSPYNSLLTPFTTTTTTTTTTVSSPSTYRKESKNRFENPRTPTQNRFSLRQQPNLHQRKSYQTENRYLIPNPLVILARDDLYTRHTVPIGERIVAGRVEVRIVCGNGQELPNGGRDILISSKGSFEQEFSGDPIIEFSLKVTDNSPPEKFALLFTILYVTKKNEVFKELILSTPFNVQSNKAANTLEPPRLLDMQPKCGSSSVETEVWIKGSEFCKKGITVTFGGHKAKVTEVEKNLLTVWAPSRPDITSNQTVVVEATNNYENDIDRTCTSPLYFRYNINPPDGNKN